MNNTETQIYKENGKTRNTITDTELYRIAYGVLLLLLIVAFICSFFQSGKLSVGGGESKKAIAALYTKSAYPYGLQEAVDLGLYDDISIGEVLSYMFKNPDVEVKKEGNYCYVTMSGLYRYEVGGDYVYNGSITYRVTESGSVFYETGASETIVEAIAMQLGKN